MLWVILPDGRMVQGLIVGDRSQQLGDWLLIDVVPGELQAEALVNDAESNEIKHG